MKKILLILLLFITLYSCSNNNLTLEGSKSNGLKIIDFSSKGLHKELYSLTNETTFGNPDDIKSFDIKLEKLLAEVEKQGGYTRNYIIDIARLYTYKGQIGKAIELYETNYKDINNKNSIVYNHNMGRLYENIGQYKLAINRYRYIVEELGEIGYLRDIADVFKKRGDNIKAKKFLEKYEELKNKIKN